MEVERISASRFVQYVEESSTKTLILDCRPFLAFNKGHIRGAVHSFCPSILKRRFAKKGLLILEHLLPQEVRKRLKCGEFSRAALYDNGEVMHESSDVDLIIQGIRKHPYGLKSVAILKGGYTAFKAMYPRLCEGKIHELHMQTAGACNVAPINMHLTTSSSDDLQVLPTELLSHLYIGDERHSTNAVSLNRVGITAILSVSTSGADKQFPEFVYKWIPIHDNVSENISAWFQEALLFIDFIRENGGKTLVHCKAGVSRSATICIAYLMVYKSFSLDQAFDFVQSKRSIVAPNLSFMQQLSEFERLLLATNTRSSYMTSSPSMTPLLTCAKTSEVSGQQGTLGNCFVF